MQRSRRSEFFSIFPLEVARAFNSVDFWGVKNSTDWTSLGRALNSRNGREQSRDCVTNHPRRGSEACIAVWCDFVFFWSISRKWMDRCSVVSNKYLSLEKTNHFIGLQCEAAALWLHLCWLLWPEQPASGTDKVVIAWNLVHARWHGPTGTVWTLRGVTIASFWFPTIDSSKHYIHLDWAYKSFEDKVGVWAMNFVVLRGVLFFMLNGWCLLTSA